MLLRFNDSALHREWTVQSVIVVGTHLVLFSGKLVVKKVQLIEHQFLGEKSWQRRDLNLPPSNRASFSAAVTC